MSNSEGPISSDHEAQWDTIAIYEQILESNPDDADALAELFRACLTVGETVRAYGFGERLGRLALNNGEPNRIRDMLELLSPFADADDGIRVVVAGLAGGARISKRPLPSSSPSPAPFIPASPTAASAPGPKDAKAATPVASGTADIISLVSSILENMPDDRDSLDVLANTYLRMEDPVQAATCFSRLADVLIRDRDYAAAEPLQEKLEWLKTSVPEAAAASERLARFLQRMPAASAQTVGVTADASRVESVPLSLVIDATRRRAVLSDEMELLWDFQQQGLVAEAQYAVVVRDLTEMTSSDSITTISALHGLSFRGFVGLDALLIQLAAKASIPVITLAGFDLQPSVFGVLPLDYLTFQGVIPFERLGGEALVAILNPFSERLRKELPVALGCPCHFFLIPPADFDTALEVVKNRYKADLRKT